MNSLVILFFVSLLVGQLGGIPLWPGVVVYVHDIVLTLLILVSLPRIIRTEKFSRTRLLKPIVAVIAAAAVSLAVNYWRFPLPELLIGSLYLVRWILYGALFVIVLASAGPAIWINGLYITGAGLGVLGLVQFVMYPYLRNLYYLGWDPHYYRVFSTLFDPNFTGIILVLTLLLGCGLWKKNKRNYFLIAGQVVAFVALLLTYSRSSYLALAVAVAVWSLWTRKLKILFAIAAFVILIVIVPRAPGSTLRVLRSESTLARVGNWQESLKLIAKSPVFGYGFDTLRYVQRTNVETSGIISKSAAGLDSSILFIIATTGVVGLAAYIYLLISMIRIGKKSYVYIASLAAVLVHSLFVNSLFYAWVMIWMWILAGVVTYDT
jgi:O-antigen ligase